MNIDAYIKEYEAVTGKKASKVICQFAKGLSILEAKFKTKGREDKEKGLPASDKEMFTLWARKAFSDDAELAETLAELAQMAYMKGYRKGGAA